MPANELKPGLIHADCMEAMKHITDGSVDMVCADVPYGTTQCAWDSVLDLELMWSHLHRIAKPSAAIVLFSAQPYTSILVNSNPGDVVLDFTMGSGTTGVACAETGRRFIGIEKELKYVEVAQRRIFGESIEEAQHG